VIVRLGSPPESCLLTQKVIIALRATHIAATAMPATAGMVVEVNCRIVGLLGISGV